MVLVNSKKNKKLISVSSIYKSVVLDDVNAAENGDIGFDQFNRLSIRAEKRLIDYLSGDVENQKPPTPYTSQKDKDWLSPFITPFPTQVKGGYIAKPADYYLFENMYMLSGSDPVDCDTDTEVEICNTPIELLDGGQFNKRCETYIKGLAPSFKKPIAKEVGNRFQVLPKDLGSITLEYVRYPVYAKIVSKLDPIYKQEVIDESKSTNYEWGDWAEELLIYFLSDAYSRHTRETALKTFNSAIGKTVRDAK